MEVLNALCILTLSLSDIFDARVCFSSMAHVLKSLDLSYNELDEVPFEALQPLKSLDWLNLHRYVLYLPPSNLIRCHCRGQFYFLERLKLAIYHWYSHPRYVYKNES
jgi:hypothetical protein